MTDRHTVSRGHVECPRRGRIDMEVCFYCPRCQAVDLDTKHPSIRCTPPRADSVAECLAYEWLGVFDLAATLHNVRQACRERHVSKYRFYLYRKCYQQTGFDGLVREFSRRKGDEASGSY